MRIEAKAELVLHSHGAEQAKGVVVEDARRDDADDAALEIGPPLVRVERLTAGERDGDRVDREVTCAEVGLDRAALEREEVHGPPIVERDSPAAVVHREREDCAPTPRPVRARGPLGLPAGDVEVEHGSPEQLVPDRAPDYPCVLAAQDFLGQLSHRRSSGGHARASSRSRRRART